MARPAAPTPTTKTTTRSSRQCATASDYASSDRPTGHRLALIRNLMTDLIRHEHLQTTEPKAAELRREVEKLIGTARANDLHARRLVAAKLYDEEVAKKLFAEIVPRYQNRPGGFTRTVQAHPQARRRRAHGPDRAGSLERCAPSLTLVLPTRRLRLTLGYRGTRYAGWAVQSPSRTRGRPTVQGTARSGPGYSARPPRPRRRRRSDRRRRARRRPGRLVRHLLDHHPAWPAARPAALAARRRLGRRRGRSRPPTSMRAARPCGAGTATPSGATRRARRQPGRAAVWSTPSRSTSTPCGAAAQTLLGRHDFAALATRPRAEHFTAAHRLRRRLAAAQRRPATSSRSAPTPS